jgi:hypothetical protein
MPLTYPAATTESGRLRQCVADYGMPREILRVSEQENVIPLIDVLQG